MSQLPPYRGGRIVGATWRGGADAPAAAKLRAHLDGWTLVQGESWLLGCDRLGHLAEAGPVVAATTVPRLFDRRAAALREAGELAPMLSKGADETLDALAPPFRLIWADREREQIHAATDAIGLGHLFWSKIDDLTICASSARLLAEIVGAAPSLTGIATFALCGTFPFTATPYEGVSRLLGGHSLVSKSSAIELSAREPRKGDAENLPAAFAEAVRAMDLAAPEATLELSGGLDSRLILAAIPRERRAGHRAITIEDGNGSDDLRIARRIATLNGLPHTAVPMPQDILRDGERLQSLLQHVIAGYDTMANPVDRLALVLTLGEADSARFGGQNGEIIRGFYYPMQPLAEPASRKLVTRLVDWRIIANDRVAPGLFSAGAGEDLLTGARAGLIDDLARFEGAWGQALDQIYVHYRMQSWVGCAASCRFVDRASLWPFFDTDFLAAAMVLDPGRKRDSHVAYELLAALDSALAAMPLDSGLIPAVMSTDGLQAKMARATMTGRKAVRKVIQRLRPRAASVLGSTQIVDCWYDAQGYRQLDLHRLASLGVLDDAQLEAVGTGRIKPDRATLGFLLLCESWAQGGR